MSRAASWLSALGTVPEECDLPTLAAGDAWVLRIVVLRSASGVLHVEEHPVVAPAARPAPPSRVAEEWAQLLDRAEQEFALPLPRWSRIEQRIVGRFPRGVGTMAAALGMTRQALTERLKNALRARAERA